MNIKYSIILSVIAFIFLSSLSFYSTAGKYSSLQNLLSQNGSKIKKIGKGIKVNSSGKIPSAAVLAKRMNVSPKMLKSPSMRKLVVVGEEIASKSPFAARFINNSKMQAEIIRQYSKYGKDEYLTMVKSVSKVMTPANKKKTIGVLTNLKGKYKGMNNVINKFNAGKYDHDVLVRIIRNTGRGGRDLVKWVGKNPLKSAGSAAFAWYWVDPEGFSDALHDSGKTLGGFVGDFSGAAVAGVGEGVSSSISRTFESYSKSSLILGSGIFLFIFLIWKSSTFRRVLFFPFSVFASKLNTKMDEIENTQHGKNDKRAHAKALESNGSFSSQDREDKKQTKPESNF